MVLKELKTASETLHVAIERYFQACSNVESACLQGAASRHLHSDYAEQIDHELEMVESYGTRIQQTKLAIKSTRNYALRFAPINSLPPEILICIFHMAREAEPHRVDRLAVVCSRWRSIALKSCSLWSHIDYFPNSFRWSFASLLNRAYLYLSRSGEMPLDLCISAASELYDDHTYELPVRTFCHQVAHRARSLELNCVGFDSQRGEETIHSVFSHLLSNCTPGVLTKLVTTDEICFGFLAAEDDAFESFGHCILRLNMQVSRLQDVLAPISVVHLTGLFLPWKSHAYHGLVDLRLCPSPDIDYSDGNNTILQSQLLDVLSASPRLRILHFGLQIAHPTEEGTVRVLLTDLEVLQIPIGDSASRFYHVENLLRLLDPGPKPLHISISPLTRWDFRGTSITETKAFFSRSNVARLHAVELPQLSELILLLPRLKDLILSGHEWNDFNSAAPPENQPGDKPQATFPRLDKCIVHNCRLPLNGFRTLIQSCQAQSLVIFKSEFYRNDVDKRINVDIGVAEKELSGICPNVTITNIRPILLEDYD